LPEGQLKGPNKICGGAGPLRLRLFAWLMARCGPHAEQYLGQYKSKLFRDLSGVVLEIGPGAGANLAYLAKLPVTWIGVEPNRFMEAHLMREAARLGMKVELREGAAERLPVEDSSVDVVISTLVLCSVVDVRAALGEVRRVLKTGGRFLFIEHVAAGRGTPLRRWQRWIKPLWRKMGDGCEPDRETRADLESAGFAKVEIEEFDAPVPLIRPHIAGMGLR